MVAQRARQGSLRVDDFRALVHHDVAGPAVRAEPPLEQRQGTGDLLDCLVPQVRVAGVPAGEQVELRGPDEGVDLPTGLGVTSEPGRDPVFVTVRMTLAIVSPSPGATFGGPNANVVYDRPWPNPNWGSMQLAS